MSDHTLDCDEPLDQIRAFITPGELRWVLEASPDHLKHLRQQGELVMRKAWGVSRYDRLEVLAMLRRRLSVSAAERAERRLVLVCTGVVEVGASGEHQRHPDRSATADLLDHELLELIRLSAATTAAEYDDWARSRRRPTARQLMARLAVFRFSRLVSLANHEA